ncbi:MAG: hypothetical protein ABW048_00085 [Sphingobium sp.]
MGVTSEHLDGMRVVPIAWLITGLVAWLGVTQLLLWRFLHVMPLWAYALGLGLLALFCRSVLRHGPHREGPRPAALLTCLAAAFLLLLLGGEGRFFYANIDWQVRLAVLHDMRVNPWPFVYVQDGEVSLLRAPIGMFLAPALVGKALGSRAADIALLIQNSLMLGTVLALGAPLFETRRARLIALAIVIGFSGLDAVGRILFRGSLSDHLENWALLQFSSMVTLAFWVPQHALSGWIGAIGYLLWRRDKLPLGSYYALLPMTALWSPLGLIGAMPFAALAGVRTLWARRLSLGDIVRPLPAVLIALPGLIYLAAAGEGVGAKIVPLVPLQWGLFELLEVLVYVIPLGFLWRRSRLGADTLGLLTLWLLAIPFVQIGFSTDFMMRASITSLTILAVMAADSVLRDHTLRLWLIVALLLGAITPLFEIRRSLSYPPAPEVRCDFNTAWDQSFRDFPKGSYLAPLAAMPGPVRPTRPTPIGSQGPTRCWEGHWYHPSNGQPSG